MNIIDYKTLIFDCDGVILNSNRVKTDAFYKSALPYGDAAAIALVNYHVSHGGISRYRKFEWFLREVVQAKVGADLQELLAAYSNEVVAGLLTCELCDGLHELRKKTENSRWMVVSGGDQDELRDIFSRRGLDVLFDGGIFGSPDNKQVILLREIGSKKVNMPAIFLGDSKYDYLVSIENEIDFVFLTRWTDFESWDKYFSDKNVPVISDISCLTV